SRVHARTRVTSQHRRSIIQSYVLVPTEARILICMRTSFCTICLVMTLLAPVATEGGARKENSGEWIRSARLLRNGQHAGSGTYLESGLVITAAHLTAIDAKMSVRMAGLAMPAKVLKQGSSQGVDL